jgi:TonB-dependent starch-binding outer membrane protein SusC
MKKDVVSKVWQLIFLLALSIPMSGFAQAIQVKGTVLDASGMTVIGAKFVFTLYFFT